MSGRRDARDRAPRGRPVDTTKGLEPHADFPCAPWRAHLRPCARRAGHRRAGRHRHGGDRDHDDDRRGGKHHGHHGHHQSKKDVKLQLLGLNDFHGQLEPPRARPAAAASGTVPAGGAEYLATHVRALEKGVKNSLVVSAGDLIGASPLTVGAVPRRADDRGDEQDRPRHQRRRQPRVRRGRATSCCACSTAAATRADGCRPDGDAASAARTSTSWRPTSCARAPAARCSRPTRSARSTASRSASSA